MLKTAWWDMSLLTSLRQSPLAIMALCNIAGDVCYLGFALYATTGLSLIKLAGALAAMAGHIILLAYGDGVQAGASREQGWAAGTLQKLRRLSQALMQRVTGGQGLAQPVFVGFGLLALNGLALMVEASTRTDFAALNQMALGCVIMAGCLAFAASDLVRGRGLAEFMVRLAPNLLVGATVLSVPFAFATLNPFILASLGFFVMANVAGYFVRVREQA